MTRNDLRRLIGKAFALPPHVAIYRTLRLLSLSVQSRKQEWRDKILSSYSGSCPTGVLNLYLSRKPPLAQPAPDTLQSATLDHLLAHRFNLLGSGWQSVAYGSACRGVGGERYETEGLSEADADGVWLVGRLNARNVSHAQKIWGLVGPDYQPIDWRRDFKSGYRWQENTWYKRISYGAMRGVDVKVPWELSRMQHLPLLAYAFAQAEGGDSQDTSSGRYVTEFRNQLLDFMALNPPRFGVNWACTMDVAIRVSNWLVAYDLFKAYGASFDQDFEEQFRCSVYEHGLHIVNNLEWSPELRGNHYLADIVGLLFVAAYLPCSEEVDAWLAFAVQELVAEVESQFHSDGSNFEGSTAYHRLSAEMVVYATALVLGLPTEKRMALRRSHPSPLKGPPSLDSTPLEHFPLPPRVHVRKGGEADSPFPDWYFERLEGMAEFAMACTRSDGNIVQVGDNDSGRFLKLLPAYEESRSSVGENHLDCHHLVAAVHSLVPRADFERFGEGYEFESEVVRALANGTVLPARSAGESSGSCMGEGFHPFGDFGLFVYRRPELYLAVRCGIVGQAGHGGHAHNDQLSFDLDFRGKPFVVDPGTYLYTPLPEERNRYRSVKSHNALCWGDREPNVWEGGLAGLFCLKDRAAPEVVVADQAVFEGRHSGLGGTCRRVLMVEEQGIRGTDTLEQSGESALHFHFHPGVEVSRDGDDLILNHNEVVVRLSATSARIEVVSYGYSPAYGELLEAQMVRFLTDAESLEWHMRLQ